MPEEFSVRGEGLTFSFRGSAYQFPEIATGSDANWVLATAHLTMARRGTFTGREPIFLFTTDLTDFLAQLRQLDRTRSGQATMDHIESQVRIAITLADGRGEISGELCEHQGPEIRFDGVPTDHVSVRRTLDELEAFVGAFPVRGRPGC